MILPPLAPYPLGTVAGSIPPAEWEACLDAWLSLSNFYLRLSHSDFESNVSKHGGLTEFLTTYYQSLRQSTHVSSSRAKEQSLRRAGFLLTHRSLLDLRESPSELLRWGFLSDFSHVYAKTQSLGLLLQRLWKAKQGLLEASLQEPISMLIKELESSNPNVAETDLERLAPYVFASSDAGRCLMTGSDLVDAFVSTYPKGSPKLQQALVTITYLGLTSLMKGEKPNHSLLFDHLYSLKAQAEQEQKSPLAKPSLLADLVTNTPILSKLRTDIVDKDADRAQTLAATLTPFKSPALSRPRRITRRKSGKGKGRADESLTHDGYATEQHVHQMSLITQIQDLFPDLGSGFVARLLDEYNEDVEQVTAHLLDDSLPPHLQSISRTLDLSPPASSPYHDAPTHLTPRHTPPPTRHNIFNDDAFDRLAISPTSLHIGRKNASLTADALLTPPVSTPQKSAILSALAAFDADDDERDDTYDASDVGGLVDASRPPDAEADASSTAAAAAAAASEESLFRAYTATPALFTRDAATRRSAQRAQLRAETRMTDEAVEGWALMLARDPKRLRRLELRFSAFDGRQQQQSAVIERTAWRENGAGGGDTTEDSDGDGGGESSGAQRGGKGGERGGRGAGRGRGRGRGRGGANAAAGDPGDRSTQIARQRKEARGSSRREGRARKMGRAGFGI